MNVATVHEFLAQNVHLHVDLTMPVLHILLGYLIAVYVLTIPGISAMPSDEEHPPRFLAWATAPLWVPIWMAYRVIRYMLYLND